MTLTDFFKPPPSPRGRFISVEGIDGAGKTTHVQAVAEQLAARGVPVVRSREPGGTPIAEQLRQLLLHEAMDPRTEALLMFAARSDHIDRVIEPALEAGNWVLCDRFTDATVAYQGFGRGFDLETLSKLEQITQQTRRQPGNSTQIQTETTLLQPDLTLWFDLDPAIAANRLAGARVPDKFESQPQAFFAQVRAGYAARAAADPDRFAVIDAEGAPAEVFARVLAACQSRAWWPQ